MPLHDVDAIRDREARTTTVMKLVRRNIDMIEHDPVVILPALMKLVCLYLVTELCHLPWREVRKQSFALFRKSLDEIYVKLETVQATEQNANDR